VYTDESYLYYPRPHLYDVLSGGLTPNAVLPFKREWYQQHNIHIQLNTRVAAINTDRQLIRLNGGHLLPYDHLVLAMGAHPFVPPIAGIDRPGVFTLRTLHDAIRIKTYAKAGGRTTIIGGGLLGLEVAVALTQLGQQVHIVELLPHLLPRQLDSAGAMILKQHIESHGIHVTLGTHIHQITGQSAVSGVLLDNGHHLPCSLVLVLAGVRPNLTVARNAGLNTRKGIVVDSKLRTSVDHIYACGNVAEFQGKVYETIPAAIEQAIHTAYSVIKKDQSEYNGTTPANTLQIAGIDLTSLGVVNPENSNYEVYKKTDSRQGIYKKLVLRQGSLVGAIILGEKTVVRQIRTWMNKTITSKTIQDLLR
jgi:nitrite reductase (NADH) large subunit